MTDILLNFFTGLIFLGILIPVFCLAYSLWHDDEKVAAIAICLITSGLAGGGLTAFLTH